jgi:hypothetical protein
MSLVRSYAVTLDVLPTDAGRPGWGGWRCLPPGTQPLPPSGVRRWKPGGRRRITSSPGLARGRPPTGGQAPSGSPKPASEPACSRGPSGSGPVPVAGGEVALWSYYPEATPSTTSIRRRSATTFVDTVPLRWEAAVGVQPPSPRGRYLCLRDFRSRRPESASPWSGGDMGRTGGSATPSQAPPPVRPRPAGGRRRRVSEL